MSDLRSEIVSKVLNSWDTPQQVETQEQSITRKVFDFVDNNPSCTINDVVAGVGIDLGRASATTLAMYQRGKLDRKQYKNPDPNGKRPNVYVYWTAVNNFTDKGIKRLMPKKQKQKKIVISQAKRIEQDILAPLTEKLKPIKLEFNPDMFVQDLSLKEARAVYEVLKGYFGA
jgi:stalled ribosome rescue protein Dom34